MNYEIRNIRRGKGKRSIYIYAELYENGELITVSTLDYIVAKLKNEQIDLE